MRTALFVVSAFSLAIVASVHAKSPYRVQGVYTETCACRAPCACELTGDVPSYCQGVGAIEITAGNFAGRDLKGVKLAYAGKPGEWVRIYIQAADAARRKAAEDLARAVFAGWGPMESVKDARIDIRNDGGTYTVKVDDGKVMTYTITPVIGGDGKSAVTLGNTHNALTRTFHQAKSARVSTFKDESRTIDLEAGRNGYFNPRMDMTGEI